jgi:hypothetical protein
VRACALALFGLIGAFHSSRARGGSRSVYAAPAGAKAGLAQQFGRHLRRARTRRAGFSRALRQRSPRGGFQPSAR